MTRMEAASHAMAWGAAAKRLHDAADKVADNDHRFQIIAVGTLAIAMGEAYKQIAEGTHPVTGTALNNY